MIQALIAYINGLIELLDTFKVQKGLCEIIQEERGEEMVSFPAEYCKNGEYKDIEDYDLSNGLIYHRLTGQVAEEEVESSISCETNKKKTYPIRTVGVVKKSILKKKNDNNYIDDKLASNIANTIAKTSVKSLMSSLKAENIEIVVSRYNTNRYEIWEEEHKNLPMKLNFEYVYLAIDYNITVEGSTSCFDIFDCDTNIEIGELCPTITEIDGGDSTSDSQFIGVNGLLDGCSA